MKKIFLLSWSAFLLVCCQQRELHSLKEHSVLNMNEAGPQVAEDNSQVTDGDIRREISSILKTISRISSIADLLVAEERLLRKSFLKDEKDEVQLIQIRHIDAFNKLLFKTEPFKVSFSDFNTNKFISKYFPFWNLKEVGIESFYEAGYYSLEEDLEGFELYCRYMANLSGISSNKKLNAANKKLKVTEESIVKYNSRCFYEDNKNVINIKNIYDFFRANYSNIEKLNTALAQQLEIISREFIKRKIPYSRLAKRELYDRDNFSMACDPSDLIIRVLLRHGILSWDSDSKQEEPSIIAVELDNINCDCCTSVIELLLGSCDEPRRSFVGFTDRLHEIANNYETYNHDKVIKQIKRAINFLKLLIVREEQGEDYIVKSTDALSHFLGHNVKFERGETGIKNFQTTINSECKYKKGLPKFSMWHSEVIVIDLMKLWENLIYLSGSESYLKRITD